MTSHKSAFNNKNKAQNKRKYCRCALFFSGAFFFGSSCGLSLYQRARYCPPSLPAGGALLCLSDNHWNQIQVLIIIHLPNVSPLVSKPALPLALSAFPCAPRHIDIYSLTFSFAPETFSGVYSFLHHPNLSKTKYYVL